ncbi:glycoside hydrolase family 65 protein [Enterococcus sp. CWB-B31]|uniref:glycoside hydrolase family 65 protein n=1 Tax=Enterococcus sp. CWB-B31 TaxID=2885159 RepID=UPI001E5323D0|nr:glycosyl hydrolase family 65 protein [Enterococcus sp. CWB-B31]MCB5954901.1 glycoside hydrolase family 65 protein [Enterococcus sp. CWB-B31]
MNYIEIHKENEQLMVLVEGRTLTFSGQLTVENAANIREELKGSIFDGGIINWSETESFMEFQEVDKFRLILEETLNKPIIFASAVKDSVEASLKEEAEYCSWNLVYHDFRTGKDEYAAESLLTTGNGFIGLRGTVPEMRITKDTYPATYLAGLYNTAESQIEGQIIKNEDFVNAPNLQYISLEIDGEIVNFTQETVKFFKRSLDLRTGLFEAVSILETSAGSQLKVTVKRVVSMANMHEYSLSYEVMPLNFNGKVTITTEADGTVFNYNVARYRSLTKQHLKVTETAAEAMRSRLQAKTLESAFTIVQEAQLFSSTMDLSELISETTDEKVIQSMSVEMAEGQKYTLEKSVAVHLYKKGEEQKSHEFEAFEISDFNSMYKASSEVWKDYWQETAIMVEGDMMSEKMLHLHTYHILVSGSPTANPTLDASITARGLHGEAYRGHIFWDELFILPFYIIHFPETARQLLMYRYNRLPAAKSSAAKAGYQGAMFPWQSGLDGTEQSQELHLNPISGEWGEDHSRLQRHVSLAIAYNVWLYNNNTEDKEFMIHHGIELLMEIAKFWLSIAAYNNKTGRYSISGVMGPDEFHEAYPGSKKGGLTDNAYTNMMVVWLFEEIEALYLNYSADDLAAAQKKAEMTREDLAQMNRIRHDLNLEINSEGVIAQFAGYFDLKEIDWTYYKEKYGNIYRMDRILSAEGCSADEYKVAKQADSLMIFYNFRKDKVDQILADMGYQLPEDYLEKNLNYYLARTSHGSTLSRIVHSQLASIVEDKELAWNLYQEALYSDYQDIQGGTTAEGIHAGVMAATLFITLTTFAGIDIRQKEVAIQPQLPETWEKLKFRLNIRGVHYQLVIDKEKIQIEADQSVRVTIKGETVSLESGQSQQLFYEGVSAK